MGEEPGSGAAVESRPPAWGPPHDHDLLLGMFVHGLGGWAATQRDPRLVFSRCSRLPPGRGHAPTDPNHAAGAPEASRGTIAGVAGSECLNASLQLKEAKSEAVAPRWLWPPLPVLKMRLKALLSALVRQYRDHLQKDKSLARPGRGAAAEAKGKETGAWTSKERKALQKVVMQFGQPSSSASDAVPLFAPPTLPHCKPDPSSPRALLSTADSKATVDPAPFQDSLAGNRGSSSSSAGSSASGDKCEPDAVAVASSIPAPSTWLQFERACQRDNIRKSLAQIKDGLRSLLAECARVREKGSDSKEGTKDGAKATGDKKEEGAWEIKYKPAKALLDRLDLLRKVNPRALTHSPAWRPHQLTRLTQVRETVQDAGPKLHDTLVELGFKKKALSFNKEHYPLLCKSFVALTDDVALLRGVLVHGHGAWLEMQADPDIGLFANVLFDKVVSAEPEKYSAEVFFRFASTRFVIVITIIISCCRIKSARSLCPKRRNSTSVSTI